MAMRKSIRGFTIVELLVVIVVIGILSALIVVVYGGISITARNITRIQYAQQAVKASQLMLVRGADFESLLESPTPNIAGDKAVCFSEGTPDIDGDAKGDCMYNSSSVSYAHENPAFISTAKQVIVGLKPYALPPPSQNGLITWLAPIIISGYIDGVRAYMLWYTLEGYQTNCKIPGQLAFISSDDYTVTNPNPYSSANSGTQTTICTIRVGP